MKAEKTRHLIDKALSQILRVDNHFKTKDIMFAHEQASLKELADLERKAKLWEENEHLIEVGKATEKFFKGSNYDTPMIMTDEYGDIAIYSTVELLEWAKGEEE